LQVKKGQSLFVNAVILQSTHFLAQADQKGTCISFAFWLAGKLVLKQLQNTQA